MLCLNLTGNKQAKVVRVGLWLDCVRKPAIFFGWSWGTQ